MKKHIVRKILAGALALPAAAFTGLSLYSRIRYNRSSGATILERLIKHKLGPILLSRESTEAYLKERSMAEDEEYVLPESKYKSDVRLTDMEGCSTILFNGTAEPKTLILYIHGGGYAGEMKDYYVRFCDSLAKRSRAQIVAPIYPLSPNHTYEEAYGIIRKIYMRLLAEQKRIILMGDSAGGGFAAGFCEYLDHEGIEEPEKLILISPWVDISMSGSGYEEYEKADPLMNVEGLRILGRAWAGETDPKNYMLSPIFGNVDALPRTLIFTGTREVFYPDILAFYEKFSDPSRVDLVVGKNMDHVYPLFPILEAGPAMKKILSFVDE